MATITTTVSDAFKVNIKKKSDAMGIRMSDYVRMVLTHAEQYEVGLKFQMGNEAAPQSAPIN